MQTKLTLADQYGLLLAQAADIKAKLDAVRDQIIIAAEDVQEGDLYRVTLTMAERVNVDWKTIALRFEPSAQLVTAHRAIAISPTVRCTARKS